MIFVLVMPNREERNKTSSCHSAYAKISVLNGNLNKIIFWCQGTVQLYEVERD
jgi:hypothetical protein